ncbi:hypothetical protein BDV30DRAFT_240733 [Aspergillus minisclerotigenes]|uniref:proline--tRNA ligase n=1 Tax=Aspergillus minisclerotigenes TaxID=656917 RepID=A0A5N6IYU6_9EURO|nr:hypothetical protein BDV30DRAFT_240733 [Aspergillus minisclerotigenes]
MLSVATSIMGDSKHKSQDGGFIVSNPHVGIVSALSGARRAKVSWNLSSWSIMDVSIDSASTALVSDAARSSSGPASRIAKTQVVIVTTQTSSTDEQLLLNKETDRLVSCLSSAGIRVKVDGLEGYSLGWRFNEWIVSGTPLFIELGPDEVTSQVVTIRRRDLLHAQGKVEAAIPELHTVIPATLANIQEERYRNALAKFQVTRIADNWDEFIKSLCRDKLVCLAPLCRQRSCELYIEGMGSDGTDQALGSHIRCLCVPLEQPGATEECATPCINPTCKYSALKWAMFGSLYGWTHDITPSPRKAARFNTNNPIRLNIIDRKFISEESQQELALGKWTPALVVTPLR